MKEIIKLPITKWEYISFSFLMYITVLVIMPIGMVLADINKIDTYPSWVVVWGLLAVTIHFLINLFGYILKERFEFKTINSEV